MYANVDDIKKEKKYQNLLYECYCENNGKKKERWRIAFAH